MIRRTDSPTPIGRTPGCLSRAISRLARKGYSPFGSTNEVHNLLPKDASTAHRSDEEVPKEVQIRFQLAASRPEGPEEPSIFRAEERINSGVKQSNRIE